MQRMTRFDPAEIRRYYDRHTPSFLEFGQGGRAGVIHRAVWGPGTTTRAEAFHYVDDRIAELAASASHVIDLGCGVGASLCYLAERLPVRGTGVTLSPVQARIAAERIRAAGLADRVACIEADYTNLPPTIQTADLAYAIESFVHGPSPERFLGEAARILRPGGLLVICDDFGRPAASAAAARARDRFCRGWRINALLEPAELQALARAAGFEHVSTTDLTPWLELHRPRDRAIDVAGALFGWLPGAMRRFGYMIGGSALQTCLARGWVRYELVVFRRL